MLKRLLLASAALFVAEGLISPVLYAREAGIVGTLTKVEPNAIAVVTDAMKRSR